MTPRIEGATSPSAEPRVTAIVRPPSARLAECALTFLEREPIDVELALRQHAEYARTLERAGARVVALPPEPDLPDATFVEDVAIILDEIAVLTRPGAASRRPEVASVAAVLADLRPLRAIEPPGTLEGGDVLRVGRTLYVGRSTRTNDDGIAQLRRITAPLGYDVAAVPVTGCLHLKTACSLVAEATVLVNRAWIDPAPLADLERIDVPADEPWGANTVLIGRNVVLPASVPGTRRLLERHGIPTYAVDLSELQKAEAGPSCLSLLLGESVPREPVDR